jgi:hypothetical protein
LPVGRLGLDPHVDGGHRPPHPIERSDLVAGQAAGGHDDQGGDRDRHDGGPDPARRTTDDQRCDPAGPAEPAGKPRDDAGHRRGEAERREDDADDHRTERGEARGRGHQESGGTAPDDDQTEDRRPRQPAPAWG